MNNFEWRIVEFFENEIENNYTQICGSFIAVEGWIYFRLNLSLLRFKAMQANENEIT